MASELYRQGKLCDTLVDALDGLITADRLPPDLAVKVLDKARLCDRRPHGQAWAPDLPHQQPGR